MNVKLASRRLPLVERGGDQPGWLWLTLWCLLVISVQPWSSRPDAPQGHTGAANNVLKGLLLGAVFMLFLASTKPGFRTRISPTAGVYIGYVLIAASTTFLLVDPLNPLLRLLRFLVALVLFFLLWPALVRRPERLVRAHLVGHMVLAATIIVGLLLNPSQAWRPVSTFGTGYRLQGVLIPMLPPRVGEIGAVLAGLALIGLLARRLPRLPGTALLGLGLLLVALSRTRTAAGALLCGVFLALLLTRRSWFGRLAAVGLPVVVVGLFLTVPLLREWAIRGQSMDRITSLSGRTLSWQYVLEEDVALQTAIIGHGLGNKSVLLRRGEGDIDVMPIDNSWLGLYWETGFLGVTIVAIALLWAWATVLRSPTPYVRACGALLVGYVSAASMNESGLSDLSSMTLHLLVAAAICDADRQRRLREDQPVVKVLPVS